MTYLFENSPKTYFLELPLGHFIFSGISGFVAHAAHPPQRALSQLLRINCQGRHTSSCLSECAALQGDVAVTLASVVLHCTTMHESPSPGKTHDRAHRLRGRTATQRSKKGSEKVLERVLGKGSQKGSEKGVCYGIYSKTAERTRKSWKRTLLFSAPSPGMHQTLVQKRSETCSARKH